jgi:hypothetical protein
VHVNGAAVSPVPKPGSYVELTRSWRSGDEIAVALPKALRLATLPDNGRRGAVMWGPIVLAGDLGPEPARGARAPPPGGGAPPRPAAGGPHAAGLDTGAGQPDVEFVPFYELHRRTYSAYWDLYTPPEYEKHLAALAAERERVRKLEAATVAFIAPGDQQNDRAANQQGEESTIVRADGRPGRRAGNWFSYDLAVDPSRPLILVATYNADTRRARAFDLLVDGQRVGRQTIPESSESRFFDVEYPIPPALVAGKQRVTIRFQASDGSEVAPVFGIRVARKAP